MIRLLSLAVPILVMLATAAGVWYSQFVTEGTWKQAMTATAKRAADLLNEDIRQAFRDLEDEADDENEAKADNLSKQINVVFEERARRDRAEKRAAIHYYACIYQSDEPKALWEREIKEDEVYSRAGARAGEKAGKVALNKRNTEFCEDREEVDFSRLSAKMVEESDCGARSYKFEDNENDVEVFECLREHRRPNGRRFWIRTAVGSDVQNSDIAPRSNFLIVNQFPDSKNWTSWKGVLEILGDRKSAVWPALLVIFLVVLSAMMVRPMLKAMSKVEKKLRNGYRTLLLMGDGVEGLNKEWKGRDIDSIVDSLVQTAIERDKSIRMVASWNINAAGSELRHALSHIGAFWTKMEEDIRAGGTGAEDIDKKIDAAKREFAQVIDISLKSVIDSAQFSVIPGPTDCKEAFEGVRTWYHEVDDHSDVEISCGEDILLPIPPLVVEFMLRELVWNAHKYVKDHECEDSIELRADTIGKEIVVEVENGGPPVSPEKRSKFFEWRWSEKGTGRGLYIARRNVENYDGTVKALDGKLGEGVRIVIKLPIAS